jgi:hypothetical protein
MMLGPFAFCRKQGNDTTEARQPEHTDDLPPMRCVTKKEKAQAFF